MHLDPTTLALQLVNFLALVLLLRRFLFKPVLTAIDRREADLAARRREAEGMVAEAQASRDAIAADRAALSVEAAMLRAQAQEAAEAERRHVLDATRQTADALRKAAEQRIAAERRQAEAELARQAGDLALAVAERLLADARPDLADAVFAEALRGDLAGLDDAARAALLGGQGAVTLTIARDWPDERRHALEALLPAGRVVWTVDPALIAGVELSAPHHLIHHSWRAALAAARDGLRE